MVKSVKQAQYNVVKQWPELKDKKETSTEAAPDFKLCLTESRQLLSKHKSVSTQLKTGQCFPHVPYPKQSLQVIYAYFQTETLKLPRP